MSLSKNSKMLQFINYRMRITLDDRRTLVGKFMAFDKHMNVVLSDCEEFRRTKKTNKEERRALGLVLLRGESVVSIAVESPPALKKTKRSASMAGLPEGAARPAPNTIPSAPVPGLAGPAPGLGPASQLTGNPRMYGSGQQFGSGGGRGVGGAHRPYGQAHARQPRRQ